MPHSSDSEQRGGCITRVESLARQIFPPDSFPLTRLASGSCPATRSYVPRVLLLWRGLLNFGVSDYVFVGRETDRSRDAFQDPCCIDFVSRESKRNFDGIYPSRSPCVPTQSGSSTDKSQTAASSRQKRCLGAPRTSGFRRTVIFHESTEQRQQS